MSQVAGKMRRGQTAGRRWPGMGSARLSSNTPCWWRKPAARSSPAVWKTTDALISLAKCRPDRNAPRTGLYQTHTHPALLQLTHKHTRTHSTSKNHEAPLLELSVTAALMAFWIKYRFLKVNGSTWMCLISNVDYFISENCILWRKYKSIYEVWFCLVDRIDRLVFTSGSCHAQSCHRLSSCCCQWWVNLRANSTSTPCFASFFPPQPLLT